MHKIFSALHVRQTGRYYLYRFADGLSFGLVIPIVVPFLQGKTFSLAAIGLGYALIQITAFLFEVPTGVISDLVSRKLALILAGVCAAIGQLVLTVAFVPPMVYSGFVALGIGMAFSSGTLSAWLHDTLEDLDQVEDFKQSIGAGAATQVVAMVVGSSLSSVIAAAADLRTVMLCGTATRLAQVILGTILAEPSAIRRLRGTSELSSVRERIDGYLSHTKESVGFVFRSPVLLSLALLHLVVSRFVGLPRNLFTQPYFATFGWTAARIALIFVVFRAVQALFSLFSAQLDRLLGAQDRRSLWVMSGIGAMSLVLLGNAPSVSILIAAYVGLSVTSGLLRPFLAQAVNARVPTKRRASVLSTVGMGFQITGLLFVPAFGRVADVYSVRVSMQLFQGLFLALLVVVVIWCSKTLSEGIAGRPDEAETRRDTRGSAQ